MRPERYMPPVFNTFLPYQLSFGDGTWLKSRSMVYHMPGLLRRIDWKLNFASAAR